MEQTAASDLRGRVVTKPSKVMIDALRRAIGSESGTLSRFRGGFWAPPEIKMHLGGGLVGTPTWWCDYRTIRALMKRGLLFWRDGGVVAITAAGIETVAKFS
jgi:hypothetical protein